MPARPPRVTRSRAIVLRRRRLGEADRIVTLLTPARGKVDAVAKGVLRPRSKLAGHLEPASHVEVLLAQGRSLDVLTQAETVEAYPATRADLDRLGTAMYLVEVTDRLTVEHADAGAAFELLHAALVRLERGDGVHLLTRSFEMHLLEAAGFRPEWEVCIGCGTVVGPPEAYWSAVGGGVVCPTCVHTHPEAGPIDLTALKVLRAIQRAPHEEAARIRLTPLLAASLERVMHDLVRSVAERDLASQHFIEAVRAVTPLEEPAPGLDPTERSSVATSEEPARTFYT
jgi:DNA repair protein RecO (recombination protein O)